jgi:drug/metabolite transporter (DMT)-like permease
MKSLSSRPALLAFLAMIFVVMIWGATFIIVQEALRDASTLLFLALRFTLAAVVLAAAFAGRYSTFPSVRRSIAAGAFAGVALFSGYFFQTVGLRYTSAPKSAFITSLSVVTVPLIASLVYRSVPRAAEGIGVVLATAGLALLTLPDAGLGVGLGDLLTVVCALSFAAHIVILGHYSARCSFQVMSLTQICTAALIAGGSFWWAEHPRVHWTPRLLIAILVTGVLATALGFAVQTWAQKHLSPTRTGLVLTLEPVFAWVTSYLVAGESLSTKGMSGALLILSGVLLAELKPAWLGRHPSQ